MMKATTYIRNYSTYWNELLPGSNKFIKDINLNSKKSKSKEANIEIEDRADFRYLISDFSYEFFIKIVEDFKLVTYLTNLNSRHKIFKNIMAEIVLKEKGFKFTKPEIEIIRTITSRIYLKYGSKNKLRTKPKFKGCGIISEGEGDLSYSNTLVELKAGERNFRIGDIRQLLIYCTLQHSEDSSKAFKYVELYNPRMGLFWRSSIEVLVLEIAGCSSTELYNEIINHISDSERAI